ncbi:MAG: DUF6055 domain-containing protein [Bellilinea sp.]
MKFFLVKFASFLAVLALALSACAQSKTTPAQEPPAEPGGTKTLVESSPTPVPTAAPGESPMGFTDLLDQKITRGEWTLEEGLVAFLKLFAGEVQPSGDPAGVGVQEAEGTGIIQMAYEYLQNGTDEEIKTEITRLLTLIVPTQAMLDPYSIPEESSRRGPGLAAPIRQTSEECASLWTSGFPDPRTPSFICFLSGTRQIGGNDYRVYYPLAWQGDASKDPYYAATLEAIENAIPVYQAYGQVKSIYLVFTTLSSATNPTTTLAVTHIYQNATEACPVILYPASLALSLPDFKQVVAHEIFHCFQAWNLRDQLITAGYASADWWVEGSAEYFSNVVYPNTDYEHRFASWFASNSTTKPLTDMTYENFAFTQFVAEADGGPTGVLKLLATMPITAGTDKQLAALGAYPNIDTLFERFAQEVIDNALMDTSGSSITFPDYFSRSDTITATTSTNYVADPFILNRYQLFFVSKHRFSMASAETGAAGHESAREYFGSGSWAPFPAEFISGCQDGHYILYVLNTEPGKQYHLTLNTTPVGDAPCDECLLGGWQATTESYTSYMQSVLSPTGDITVTSITGEALAIFNDNGIGTAQYQDFVVHYTSDSSDLFDNPIPMDFSLTFTGYGSGYWTADGTNLTFNAGEGNITSSIQAFISGEPIDLGETANLLPEVPPAPIGSGPYTCSENTLTYWPPVTTGTVSPIIFKKIW